MAGTKRCRYSVGAGELCLFGRRIYTAGANGIKAGKKIQDLTLAGAHGHEIANWPEDLWRMLGTRNSVPGAQVFGTCSRAGPYHWLKRQRRLTNLEYATSLQRWPRDDLKLTPEWWWSTRPPQDCGRTCSASASSPPPTTTC
ncbi:hypothetical protein [Micromonospora sp. WMMD1082]|uniref:hypothetical protein n=1 Tax=Micromonospora sp. WMMD1082 TaxID=3016104 RepID=UPI002417083D|nr:hypothetical protein [Micromonospora sp. WMMD1082]MDG4795391.1 hypothetical protein [Micromonospora sp. WMMD1082]